MDQESRTDENKKKIMLRNAAGLFGVILWTSYTSFRGYLSNARPGMLAGNCSIRFVGDGTRVVYIRALDEIVLWVLVISVLCALAVLVVAHWRVRRSVRT